jgi:hypothetical protein
MKLTRAAALLALTASIVAACGSPRQTTVEGYSSQNLNRKRIVVLLPAATEITFTNAEQFATSRGVAGASAAETFDSELRSMLVGMIQDRLDSNTVMSYAEMPVAGMYPLSATRDFGATGPLSWDNLKRAGQEGAIDYLLVLRDVRVGNTAGSDPRGNETVSAAYSLLDIRKQSVMTSGTLSVDVSAPRVVSTTHERIATELTGKLPFTVVE